MPSLKERMAALQRASQTKLVLRSSRNLAPADRGVHVPEELPDDPANVMADAYSYVKTTFYRIALHFGIPNSRREIWNSLASGLKPQVLRS